LSEAGSRGQRAARGAWGNEADYTPA
jgi:hypothetical protein